MGTTGIYLQPSHTSSSVILRTTIVMRFLAIVLVVALVGGAQAWSLGNIKENENKLVAEDKVEDLAEDIEDEEDELEDDDDDEDELEDDDDDDDEDDDEDLEDDDEDDEDDLDEDDEDDDDDEDE